MSADVEVTPMVARSATGAREYTVRVTMEPNAALIETSVTIDEEGRVTVSSQTFERLDRYGTTSHCVVGDLRTICYCRVQLLSSTVM